MNEISSLSESTLQDAQNVLQSVFPDEPKAQVYFARSLLPKNKGASYFEYFVLKRGGTVVGTTGLYYDQTTPKALWLGWYGVLASERGKGLGGQLLNFSIDLAIKKGAKFLNLWTSDQPDMKVASQIYEKKGFVVTHREFDAKKNYEIITYSLELKKR